MSKDYHIKCVTCDSVHYLSDANHAIDLTDYLIKNAKLIGTLKELFDNNPTPYEGEIHFGRWRLNVNWFNEHSWHALISVDEYSL